MTKQFVVAWRPEVAKKLAKMWAERYVGDTVEVWKLACDPKNLEEDSGWRAYVVKFKGVARSDCKEAHIINCIDDHRNWLLLETFKIEK